VTAPRRRIIRPVVPSAPDAQHQLRLQKLRASLERERAMLARWMAKLKRAFHAVEKAQQRGSRLERQITKMEETHAPDH
jgi:hypothetical protein